MTNLLIGFPDIPQSAGRIDSNNSFATNTPIHNLRAGERYQIAKLSTATSDLTRVNYDLGSETKAANYLAIARADLLQAANVARVVVRGSSASAFAPGNISNLRGWWDFTRGVTTSTGISAITDQSGTGATASQGTAGAQPIKTRGDTKENIFTRSEELDHADWRKTRTTISANSVANPIDGATTADTIIEDSSASTSHLIDYNIGAYMRTSTSYTFTCYAKKKERHISLRFFGFTSNPFAHFNLTNGTVHSVDSGVSATVTDMGSGWYRLSATASSPSSAGTWIPAIHLADSPGSYSYNGDGASGAYVYGAQFQRTNGTDTTYLHTTSSRYYSGINDNVCGLFDGSDDVLTASGTTINVSGAFTAFVVFQQFQGSNDAGVFGNDYSLFATTAHMGTTFYFYVGGSSSVNTPITLGSTYIMICTWDGTTGANGIKLYKNGTTVTTQGTSSTTPSGTATYRIGLNNFSTYFNGKICECGIYSGVISSDDRTSLYNYLNDKWNTAAPIKSNSFATDTLYGQGEDDFITTTTASSEYRNWWVDYESTASGSLEHSKLYLGGYFDFGKDPADIKIMRGHEKQRIARANSGAVRFGKNEQTHYTLEISWNGITNAKVEELQNSIADQATRNRGVFLFTTSDHAVLDNQRILHCKISDIKVTAEEQDFNRVTCYFEEMIG